MESVRLGLTAMFITCKPGKLVKIKRKAKGRKSPGVREGFTARGFSFTPWPNDICIGFCICFVHRLVWVSVLVFSDYTMNCHKFNSLKQHPFIISQFCRCTVQVGSLGCLLGVPQAEIRVSASLCTYPEVKVGRIQFSVTLELRSPSPCWLPARIFLNSKMPPLFP